MLFSKMRLTAACKSVRKFSPQILPCQRCSPRTGCLLSDVVMLRCFCACVCSSWTLACRGQGRPSSLFKFAGLYKASWHVASMRNINLAVLVACALLSCSCLVLSCLVLCCVVISLFLCVCLVSVFLHFCGSSNPLSVSHPLSPSLPPSPSLPLSLPPSPRFLDFGGRAYFHELFRMQSDEGLVHF